MDNLIKKLYDLERYVPYYKEYLHNYKHRNKFLEAFILHVVSKISNMCCDLLINGDGSCNWENIEYLQNCGFYVGPGERDSFGWLTGIVGTSKGNIVYG